MQEAKRLFREASNLVKEEEKLKTACRLVNKGLLYNPSFHALYALKGDIQLLQGFQLQYNKYKSKFLP